MSPLFYEDSLGAKLSEMMTEAADRAHEAEMELIDDPEALERAENAVHDLDTTPDYGIVADDWVTVFGPSKVSGILDVAGPAAMLITMPLDAEGIAYCWDPYPPADMPGAATPAEHGVDMPFSLLVAPMDERRARDLLADSRAGSRLVAGVPATHDLTPEAKVNRRMLSTTSLVLLYGVGIAVTVLSFVFWLIERLR
jgi:hypothetical protein